MIRKILSLIGNENKGKVYFLICCLFAEALLEMLGVGIILPFITTIQNPDLIHENRYLKLVYNYIGINSFSNFIMLFSVVILLFYLIKNSIIGYTIFWQSRFLASMEAGIATNLLSKYLGMDYEKYLSRNTANLINNISIELPLIFAGLIKPFFILISDSLIVFLILSLLIFIAPEATLAAIITIGSAAFLFYFTFRNRLKNVGKIRQENREKMVKWVGQGFGGLKELTILNRKQSFIDNFALHAQELIGIQTFSETTSLLPRIIIETFGVLVLVVITLILLQEPKNFLPIIALFAMAAFRMMPAISRITSSLTKVRYYSHSLNNILNDYTTISSTKTDVEIEDAKLKFSFNNVITIQSLTYSYPNTQKNVVNNINLEIKKGQSVGIIGPSGSGKSTFVDILLGLLPPQNGSILVDGIDIRNHIKQWHKLISYMPQAIYLTDDSIKRNVAIGVEDNKIDESLVWECLEKAQADEFVRNQPNGLETFVGERGARLSGGQRQRIGIARALYNQPKILILDEATSALDPEVESKICNTLQLLAKEITIIAISHQKKLISIADKVYNMVDGNLALNSH